MDIETLLNSPLAAVRAFAAILPSVMEEDPEGAVSALAAAATLAEGLKRWKDYPYGPRDTAYLRVSAMFNRRTSQTCLSMWDLHQLRELCLTAAPLPKHADSEIHPYSFAFESQCAAIENTWQDEHEERH